MKRYLCLAILSALLLTSCGSAETNLMTQNGITAGLRKGSTDENRDIRSLEDFTLLMWRDQTDRNPDNNTLISPLSAYIALAMCANGAKGETLTAFQNHSFHQASMASTNDQLNALIGRLIAGGNSTELHLANSIWLDDRFNPAIDYLKTLSEDFGAEAFSANLPSSINRINSWIEDRTNGLIKEMINELSDSAVAVLINTLYMKAQWMYEFNPKYTHESNFTNVDKSISVINFMNNGTRDELIIDTKTFEGVLLPYNDDRLAFLALMPKDGSDIESLFHEIGESYSISDIIALATYENTTLTIPKFELETSQSITPMLRNMGLDIAFDPDNADFSGMGDADTAIYISDVLQNAVLIFDEKGTEASAATVVVMDTTAIIDNGTPRVMVFDRPFVFAVVDKSSGAVLFCGNYMTAD